MNSKGNTEPSNSEDAFDAQICIRAVEERDLPTLFHNQMDAEGNRMSFTVPRSREEFDTHWEKILKDPTVIVRAILLDSELAGCVSCFRADGVDSVGYWIGREFWGRGVATNGLKLLLNEVSTRPLHARVAVTNQGSIRVLEKCGFVLVSQQHSAGAGRFLECEEAFYELR